jgi:hypothetical protein
MCITTAVNNLPTSEMLAKAIQRCIKSQRQLDLAQSGRFVDRLECDVSGGIARRYQCHTFQGELGSEA